MIKFLHNPEDKIIRVGIVLIMMLTTIMFVNIRWMKCEVLIFYGIPVLLLIGFVVLIWRRQKFNCTLTDIIAIAWFVYYVGRAWIGNECPCQMEFMKASELFLLYASLRVAFDGTKMSAWVLIGSIIVFGCYEAYLGASQIYGDKSSNHSLFAVTGNFLNPGPYSAYLMIGVVVGLVSLREASNRVIVYAMPKFVPVKITEWLKTITWKHLIISAIAVMSIMLPATWSRAAFLGVAVVTLFIYRDKYWKYRYLVWGVVLLLGVAFYFIKQGSADGRLIIWKSALTTWVDSPWLGVGVGGFYRAFAEGIAQLSTSSMDFSSVDVPDGAYNFLLKVVVEQGVVGAVIAVGFVVAALVKLLGNSRPLFYGMIALLVFAMFSYPFDLLPYKVIAVLIVAWSESVGGKRLYEINRLKLLFLSCFLGFASWQAGDISNECYNAEKEIYTGFVVYSSVEHYYNLMASEGDNPVFLFEFGKRLREERRYNDSNSILRQGTRCSADPMFHVLMGNNYKDMKYYDLAEQSYNRAFSVMPNRLYPLYQLMLLYLDSGDVQKVKIMAKRVVDMKPKIESQATRDMKNKAKEFL